MLLPAAKTSVKGDVRIQCDWIGLYFWKISVKNVAQICNNYFGYFEKRHFKIKTSLGSHILGNVWMQLGHLFYITWNLITLPTFQSYSGGALL